MPYVNLTCGCGKPVGFVLTLKGSSSKDAARAMCQSCRLKRAFERKKTEALPEEGQRRARTEEERTQASH